MTPMTFTPQPQARRAPSSPLRASTLQRVLLAAALATCCNVPLGCGKAATDAQQAPNILWVVWDTTRADHMSLYGHDKPTTPFLEEWAKDARVFEHCSSTGCSTVPSHAGMFTGMLPSEHGTRFGHQWLEDQHETIAELLGGAGYQTYLWSANPHISAAENFVQGFQTVEHPWDEETRTEAFKIVLRKIRRDHSSELPKNIQQGKRNEWMIKAAGELAEVGLTKWLDERDSDKPYFAFINYMEAHRPFIPPARYRKRMMSKEDVDRSFTVDRSWTPMWAYTFGVNEYTQKELEIMAGTYDAALAELDDIFKSLIQTLEERGELENTVVILTADHGEHLGEHHMLDHQYALYDALTRVPLIVHAPGRFLPGRDETLVANFDIFPTLLELAGIDPSEGHQSTAVSLLHPNKDRPLLAEMPATFTEPFIAVGSAYPDFDPNKWSRKLRAFRYGDYKLLWSSAGDHELYHMPSDPMEARNLFAEEPERAAELMDEMNAFLETLQDPPPREGSPPNKQSPEQLQMLRDLGYISDGDDQEDEED
ncbi:MAG: arylsulfatase A-like enzyme [Candidatus Paceibacteria bacterium]|jgi:arylsulfatase A-like enzyme